MRRSGGTAIVYLVGAVLSACGGGSSGERRPWTTESTTVMPGELVRVSDAQATFTSETYEGTLGSVAITLARVDAHELAFLVPPQVAAGSSVALEVQGAGARYEPLTFQIEAAPRIGDAVAYVTAYLEGVNAAMDQARTSAAGDPLTSTFLDRVQVNIDHLSDLFAAADAAGQLALATFMAANPDLFGVLPQARRLRWAPDTVDFEGLILSGARLAFLGAAVVLLSRTVVTGWGALATSAAAVAFVLQARDFRARVIALWHCLVVPDLDTMTASAVSNKPVAPRSGTLTLSSGVPASISVTGTYRTLTSGDSSSSSQPLAAAATAIGDGMSIWAVVDALLFGSLGEAPGLGPVESQQQSVDPAFLSVDAASLPSTVTLTSSTRTAATLDVVLVSSGEESFTMQLAYDDGLVVGRVPVTVNLSGGDPNPGMPDGSPGGPADAGSGTDGPSADAPPATGCLMAAPCVPATSVTCGPGTFVCGAGCCPTLTTGLSLCTPSGTCCGGDHSVCPGDEFSCGPGETCVADPYFVYACCP